MTILRFPPRHCITSLANVVFPRFVPRKWKERDGWGIFRSSVLAYFLAQINWSPNILRERSALLWAAAFWFCFYGGGKRGTFVWKNDPCFFCAHTLIHSILLLIHPIPNFQSPKPLIFPLIPEPYPFARCQPIQRHVVGERPERNLHRWILEQSAVEDERGGKAAGARIFPGKWGEKPRAF